MINLDDGLLKLLSDLEESSPNFTSSLAEVYPITFTMPDGSTITLESEEGFSEMESWYEANDSYEQEPTFQYPIEIVLRDEEGVTTLTINNDEELEEAEENCED